MASQELVSTSQSHTVAILKRLDDASIPIVAAIWLAQDGSAHWKLVLATETAMTEGPRRAYEEVIEALKPESSLTPFTFEDMAVVDPRSTVVRAIQTMVAVPTFGWISSRQNIVNGIQIPDSIIVRSRSFDIVAAYRKSLGKIDPNNPDATIMLLNDLAAQLSVQGKHDEALEAIDEAIERVPELLDSLRNYRTVMLKYNKSVTLANAGRVGDAIDFLRQMIDASDPADSGSTALLLSASLLASELLLRQGNIAESVSALEGAKRRFGHSQAAGASQLLHRINELLQKPRFPSIPSTNPPALP